MSWSRLSLGTAGALGGALGLILITAPGATPAAHACGCFAPPDPSVPIVQAGERILFGMEDGVVTAHIQIQYEGDAEEFAWLVPMPAEPTLSLGTDELFTQITTTTQPRYRLETRFDDECPPSRDNGGGGGADGGADNGAPEDDGPLVSRDTVGPYETAVLRAGDKQEMLDWLADNRFFVPAGTDQAVTPYIRPGAFFLALKLRSGESVGDLQPVVVKYQSELPQIPIVLTSVAADPDMPVLVWVLGDARAIPRNFFHTHINDALIDWFNAGANYLDVVTEAVNEADGHHSFITEYAGPSSIMQGVLDPSGRFGDREYLRATTEPAVYLSYLWQNGYGQRGPFGDVQVTTQILSILEGHLPMPDALVERVQADWGYPLTPVEFYVYFDSYVASYPEILLDAYPDFDPAVLTDELEERIVTPTLAAGQMFRDYPYLTRLFTTLSPDEMTKDPVFSFNPDLPEVSNEHWGELVFLECSPYGGVDFNGPALLVTEQGWRLYLPDGPSRNDWQEAGLPASLRIEMLREEGAAQVVTDNAGAITTGVDTYRPVPQPKARSGCSTSPGAAGGAGAFMMLALAGLLMWRRRA
jgi:MYXO-CTERM domain-containing protein